MLPDLDVFKGEINKEDDNYDEKWQKIKQLSDKACQLLKNLQTKFCDKFENFEKSWKSWNTSQLIDWLKMIDFPKSVHFFGPTFAFRH